MSLISCPECGKQFSDKASACPNCAYPYEKFRSRCKSISPVTSQEDKELEAALLALSFAINNPDKDESIKLKQEFKKLYFLMVGINSPCHICGAEHVEKFSLFPFGMAKMISETTDWTKTAFSVGLSAIILPLLGVGWFSGPDENKRAKIIYLYLFLCDECIKDRKKLFGGTKISSKDYTHHPCYNAIKSIGYTTILNSEKLSGYHTIKK